MIIQSVYVDKTEHVYNLINNGSVYFVYFLKKGQSQVRSREPVYKPSICKDAKRQQDAKKCVCVWEGKGEHWIIFR
jgi:hypothetical protein